MALSMLVDSSHVPNPNRLWVEAIHTANYLRNRFYTSAGTEGTITQYESNIGASKVTLLRMTRVRCLVRRRCAGDGTLTCITLYLEYNRNIFQLILY